MFKHGLSCLMYHIADTTIAVCNSLKKSGQRLHIFTGASRRLEPVMKCCLFLSCFQGPAFRCDKIVVIVTLREAIEGIPDKDYNFWWNENFHNFYERLLHERKPESGYLERHIYERPLHLRVNILSRIKANIFQNYLNINLS